MVEIIQLVRYFYSWEKEFNKISNSKDVKKNIEDALKKEYSDGIKNVKYTYLTREDSTLDINTVVTYFINRNGKNRKKVYKHHYFYFGSKIK